MALAVVLIILSGILDFNTLFFLAAAAFFIGIMIREYGLLHGAAFFAGCLILGFLLAPQKLYCITYAMMGIYVLAAEGLWQFLGTRPGWKRRKMILAAGKLAVFNIMYLPALWLYPGLFFAGEIPHAMLLFFVLGGQAAWFLYDRAYEYFLVQMWEQVRGKIFGRG